MGPNHGAIMLTGQPAEPHWGPPTNVTPEEMIFEYENSFRRAVQAQNSLAQMTQQASAFRHYINGTTPSPTEPPAQGRLPNRPLPLDSGTTRYYEGRDDGSTVLGRHIAAREQAAQRQTPSRLDINPNLGAGEQAGALPSRSDTVRYDSLVEDAVMASQRSAQLGERMTQIASPASPGGPLLWRQEPRRRRILRTDTRPPSATTGSTTGTTSAGSIDRQSRLSMLSSFSGVQNFTSPFSAASSMVRPLLFEEPESYVDPLPPPPLPPLSSSRLFMEPDVPMVEDIPFGRNYIVRRQMTAEGAERIHNLQLEPGPPGEWPRTDPSDYFGEQARRRTMMQSFQERTRGANGSNLITVRRRGWARLDLDGDEIPQEEDDELERARTEYRMRALQRARTMGTPQSASLPESARRVGYGSIVDAEMNVRSTRGQKHQEEEPDYTPYTSNWISPLPMPLDEMVPVKKKARCKVIVVDPEASFAGR